jgi:hypothetical protein
MDANTTLVHIEYWWTDLDVVDDCPECRIPNYIHSK